MRINCFKRVRCTVEHCNPKLGMYLIVHGSDHLRHSFNGKPITIETRVLYNVLCTRYEKTLMVILLYLPHVVSYNKPI